MVVCSGSFATLGKKNPGRPHTSMLNSRQAICANVVTGTVHNNIETRQHDFGPFAGVRNFTLEAIAIQDHRFIFWLHSTKWKQLWLLKYASIGRTIWVQDLKGKPCSVGRSWTTWECINVRAHAVVDQGDFSTVSVLTRVPKQLFSFTMWSVIALLDCLYIRRCPVSWQRSDELSGQWRSFRGNTVIMVIYAVVTSNCNHDGNDLSLHAQYTRQYSNTSISETVSVPWKAFLLDESSPYRDEFPWNMGVCSLKVVPLSVVSM